MTKRHVLENGELEEHEPVVGLSATSSSSFVLEDGSHGEAAHVIVPEEGGWRKLLAYLGPGFLVAIAYIDPANFESDLQAGASFQYELLWVLLLASIGGLFIQSLSANLGIVTEKHLAQHCRSEYPPLVNSLLWIIAELEIIASDIPEVIGTAFALNMLFRLKIWVGVVLTGLSTILLLAVQKYGIRKLEVVIALLVFVMAGCFFAEIAFIDINDMDVIRGLLVPHLASPQATAIAISLVGAIVMPHNLFLHSALVLSRKQQRTPKAIRDGCRYAFIEVMIALVIAFAINVSVICVGGAVCHGANISEGIQRECGSITLNNAYFLLQNTLGGWAPKIFGIALLASGQSSTITGTYAGQYVMQGFLELSMKTWLRNLVTRLVAIVPSLVVSLVFGARGASRLIIICSMVLSFGLPYALIPLLKFTSSRVKMGEHVNSYWVSCITWTLGFLVISINCCFLLQIFYLWLQQRHIADIYRVPLSISVLLTVGLYASSLLYLALRRDAQVTFTLLPEEDEGKEVEDVELLPTEAQWSGKIISQPRKGDDGIPEIEFASPTGKLKEKSFLFFEFEEHAPENTSIGHDTLNGIH